MATQAEIEAAKERLDAAQYDDVVVFTKRGDKFSTLEFSPTMQRDLLLLSAAFVSQQQPVNERLLTAAKTCRSLCDQPVECDGLHYMLDTVISAAEAEIEERRKPVTEEWLNEVGFTRDHSGALLERNDASLSYQVWPSGKATLNVCGRPLIKFPQRWHVLDLMRVIGGDK